MRLKIPKNVHNYVTWAIELSGLGGGREITRPLPNRLPAGGTNI